jgi:hypothetical protein
MLELRERKNVVIERMLVTLGVRYGATPFGVRRFTLLPGIFGYVFGRAAAESCHGLSEI